jgi:2-dehydro-3-deoxygluconokinase
MRGRPHLAEDESSPLSRNAVTIVRGAVSASENLWTAVLAADSGFYRTTRFRITPILDRVGSGDAFAGAAIYQLVQRPDALQETLDFAAAASCLKH